jgi:transcriptional regulator with XRE-family HTH domain
VRAVTEVSVVDRRALNQAFLFAARAPAKALRRPGVFVRALRSALRMSQSQLERRSGVPRAHIARLEAGSIDARLSTVSRLFDAMFCDLVLVPRPRKRPGDAVVERRLEKKWRWRIWDE